MRLVTVVRKMQSTLKLTLTDNKNSRRKNKDDIRQTGIYNEIKNVNDDALL